MGTKTVFGFFNVFFDECRSSFLSHSVTSNLFVHFETETRGSWFRGNWEDTKTRPQRLSGNTQLMFGYDLPPQHFRTYFQPLWGPWEVLQFTFKFRGRVAWPRAKLWPWLGALGIVLGSVSFPDHMNLVICPQKLRIYPKFRFLPSESMQHIKKEENK